ncbi:small kinetochore-associated protein [Tiliqua scincoides]|uniref:small kinetochore-associated protein n=1 Tax=Tiliqua scincoides TaxID=71010 RepID=UPI003462B33B
MGADLSFRSAQVLKLLAEAVEERGKSWQVFCACAGGSAYRWCSPGSPARWAGTFSCLKTVVGGGSAGAAAGEQGRSFVFQAVSMENEKSRIPVYSSQHSTVSGVLKDANPQYTFGPNLPACAVSRGTNQRPLNSKKEVAPPLPKKTVATAPVRNMTNKYRRETELRNKNKALETTACELNLKLTGMQSTIKDLQEQNDELEKENQKLKKFQESCMLILETRDCDSVTGNSILEEEKENEKNRTEIMVLTEELNAGLEQFNQMVKEQKDNLQNAQTKWKQVAEERTRFLEQQQSFRRKMEDLSALLDEEEKEALLN